MTTNRPKECFEKMNPFRVRRVFPLILLWITCSGILAWPKSEVNSREYKTMLRADVFANVTFSKAINNDNGKDNHKFLNNILRNLQATLVTAASKAGAAKSRGRFTLKKGTPRHVHYYDTPGHCWLRHHSLTLRLRRDIHATSTSTSQEEWEGMLKSRSGDRYHTSYRQQYIQGCHKSLQKGKHKMEEDIGNFDWTGNVYSFSQKCHLPVAAAAPNNSDSDRGDTATLSPGITSLRDIATAWDSMEDYLQSSLNLELETELQLVGNTSLIEVAYEDFWIPLEDDADDDQIAQAKLTLWYAGAGGTVNNSQLHQPSSSSSSAAAAAALSSPPIVAELSFRIQSKHEAWSDPTIMTMHTFWETLGTGLQRDDWLDPESMTKTAWIYQYDDTFCQFRDDSGEDE